MATTATKSKPNSKAPSYDELAETVTNSLVKLIESGAIDGKFEMPWTTNGSIFNHLNARNGVTGIPYKGANVLALATQGLELGYPTGEWATYRQWNQAGGQVRKDEHASYITKWIPKKNKDEDAGGEATDAPIPSRSMFPRTYAVFNRHQVDLEDAIIELVSTEGGNELADEWITKSGSDLHLGGDAAYYMPVPDRIYAPGPDQYQDSAAYYSVLLHEHIHWTGHQSRLARDIVHPFGSPDYAREELVAELGAAIACARIGISNDPRPDHAQYLRHWLSILREDPKALFKAMTGASKAVQFLDPNSDSDYAANPMADASPESTKQVPVGASA